MMIDEVRFSQFARRPFKDGYSHLTTDSDVEELHQFAKRLGLKRSWFQHHELHPHYDLTPQRRIRALQAGAVFVPAKKQAKARLERHRTEERT